MNNLCSGCVAQNFLRLDGKLFLSAETTVGAFSQIKNFDFISTIEL